MSSRSFAMDELVLKTLARDVTWLLLEHIWLVFVAGAISTAVGVTLGIVSMRHTKLRKYAVGFANVSQTIPSLVMFGFLIPIPIIGGIGKRVAIISLVLYALLPILRNTIAGIAGVDAAVRESAVAMGMTPRQILWQVEFPLAAPSIV